MRRGPGWTPTSTNTTSIIGWRTIRRWRTRVGRCLPRRLGDSTARPYPHRTAPRRRGNPGRPRTTLSTFLWFKLSRCSRGSTRWKAARSDQIPARSPHGQPLREPLVFYPRYLGEIGSKAWRYWAVYQGARRSSRRSRGARPLDLYRLSIAPPKRTNSKPRPLHANGRGRSRARTQRTQRCELEREPAGCPAWSRQRNRIDARQATSSGAKKSRAGRRAKDDGEKRNSFSGRLKSPSRTRRPACRLSARGARASSCVLMSSPG